MNRWDDALGVPDPEWACIAAIAARGGVDSTQSGVAGFLAQIEPTEYMQRLWRRLVEACRQASDAGDHRLVCRVFMSVEIFTMSFARRQTCQYLFTNVGLVPTNSQHQSDLAQPTVVSLEHFPPQEVLQEYAAGIVEHVVVEGWPKTYSRGLERSLACAPSVLRPTRQRHRADAASWRLSQPPTSRLP